jgi:hypothetical protein
MGRTITLALSLALVVALAFLPGAAAADTTADDTVEPTTAVSADDPALGPSPILFELPENPGWGNCISGGANCVGTGG